MSDDIVTRLREVAVQEYKDGWVVFPVCDRAANEIERLRADRDRWKNWAEEYFYTDPDCECPLCDQVRAAIEKTVRP